MNVLIVYDGPKVKPLADAIAQGAKELDAAVTIKTTAEKPALKGFDFVFVGGVLDKQFSTQTYLAQQDVAKTKIALFCVKKGPASLEQIIDALQKKGASVEKNTFSSKIQGGLPLLGGGKVKEEDIIRARGFGERTLNVAFGLEIQKDTEKADKIKGYVK